MARCLPPMHALTLGPSQNCFYGLGALIWGGYHPIHSLLLFSPDPANGTPAGLKRVL